MSTEDRLSRIENILGLLVEHGRNVEDRMDDLTAAQANSESKIAALADAQIRTEIALEKLTGRMDQLTVRVDGLAVRMDELAVRMSELAAAQAHTDKRLDALIDIVREGRNGRSQG